MVMFVITGTSQGIGKALAELALDQGHQVIGISRNKRIQHELYTHYAWDLSDVGALSQKVDELFQVSTKNADSLYLINNAATLGEVGHMGQIPHDVFGKAYALNVAAPSILMNAFIRHSSAISGGKVIINISSGASKKAYDGWSAYCTSKAAIDMLSQVADKESTLEGNGINVFSVAPGVVETQMQAHLRTLSEKDFSNQKRFVQLKEDNLLDTPASAAAKIFKIIENPNGYQQVLLDVREL